MKILNNINHSYDINLDQMTAIDSSQNGNFNACEVALESESETRCDDGRFDCAGTLGTLGSATGCFGTVGTFGCCC